MRRNLLFFLLLIIVFTGFQYMFFTDKGHASTAFSSEEKKFWLWGHELSGKGYERTVIVGDLPTSYDRTLLLRKGRRIPVVLNWGLQRKFPYYFITATIEDSIRDESGQFELQAKGTDVNCLYKIKTIGKRARIKVVANGMQLDARNLCSVEFTKPPRYLSKGLLKASVAPPIWMLSGEEREEYEIKRLRRYEKNFFASPVMSVEIILDISRKNKYIHWPVEDTSGNLDILIRRYRTEFIVEKDILFSDYTDPVLSIPGEMWGTINLGKAGMIL